MRFVTGLSMLAVVLGMLATSARADEKAASAAARRFEALKGLAGEWVEVNKDGRPTDRVVTSLRVTAAGSAVQETLFPGTPHKMVTMYHLDGADLVLTHYCVLGNQPLMRAEPGDDVHRIVFKFVRAANLKSEEDPHMHQATFKLGAKDRFQAEWVSCKDGQPCRRVSFDLARKPK
jgi:hypothetical protein